MSINMYWIINKKSRDVGLDFFYLKFRRYSNFRTNINALVLSVDMAADQ